MALTEPLEALLVEARADSLEVALVAAVRLVQVAEAQVVVAPSVMVPVQHLVARKSQTDPQVVLLVVFQVALEVLLVVAAVLVAIQVQAAVLVHQAAVRLATVPVRHLAEHK